MREENLTPFVEKYEKTLKENPSSLVFAPLAECYRKLGLKEQAVALLREGIKRHPNYILGYIGLAQIAFEQGHYELVYTTLKPHLESHRDNFKLMRLYSDACYHLENFEEALNGYKYILFLNPKNEEVSRLVSELENNPLDDSSASVDKPGLDSRGNYFDIDALKTSPKEDEENWVQKDFSKSKKRDRNQDIDGWMIDAHKDFEKSSNKEEEPVEVVVEEKIEKEEERSFKVVSQNVRDAQSDDQPIITHTLVDLYLSQGYLDKAQNLLEKILELNPKDRLTSQRLEEVKQLLSEADPQSADEDTELDEEKQRANLMNLIDKKVVSDQEDQRKSQRLELEATLWDFHQRLKDRASQQLRS